MSGAYADAMASKWRDLVEHSREVYGVELESPRVLGQYCPWPCVNPRLVIDHRIKRDQAYLIDGHIYQGRV